MWAVLWGDNLESYTPFASTQISPGKILKVLTKESSSTDRGTHIYQCAHTHTNSHTTKCLNAPGGLSPSL